MGDGGWIGFLLGVPLFSALVVGLVPLLVPTFRWSRQLSRDLQIWKDMPEGREKRELEEFVQYQARRIRQYREIPTPYKASGWASLVLIVAACASALTFGVTIYPAEWVLVAGALLSAIWCIPIAVAGRVLGGPKAGEMTERDEQRMKPESVDEDEPSTRADGASGGSSA